MLFARNVSGRLFAKDPAVVKLHGVYWLYHSLSPKTDGPGWTIGIAQSTDLEHWEVAGEIKPTQECEKNGIAAPGAIVLDGAIHLFYQTYGNGRLDAICHAVSTDGITFRKDETNPVYRPEATWCCGRAIDADLCVFGGRLHLYFATRDHAFRIQKVGGAAAELGSGFSAGAWKPLANQALLSPELSWEGECIEAPACLCHDGRIYLFYGGSYNCTPQQIGCAVSSDGVFFERTGVEPILANGPAGAWNASESGHPFVFRDDDGRVHLFYQGSPDNGETWYLSRVEIGFQDGKPFVCEGTFSAECGLTGESCSTET